MLLLITLLFSYLLDEPIQKLSAEEKIQLENGELVLHKRAIDSLPWPETTTYAIVEASPEEAFAVFTDFDAQEEYIPRVIESLGKPGSQKWIKNLEIKAEVPWPVNKTSYTTGNIFEKLNNDAFRVRWFFIEAEHFHNTEGYAAFYPYKGKTLFIYQSLVEPQTAFLAQFFKGKVISENKQVVDAIRQRINQVAKNKKNYLSERVEKINKLLEERN